MEALRILAMLMVLWIHADYVALGSPFDEEFVGDSQNAFWHRFWENAGIAAVNVFVMISGWFGIKLRVKSICNYLFTILFWSVAVMIVLRLTCPEFFGSFISIPAVVKGAANYWFVNAYLILMLLSPAINDYMQRADNRKVGFTAISLMICAVALNFVGVTSDFRGGYSALWMITMYILGGYLRRTIDQVPGKWWHWLAGYLIFAAAMAAVVEFTIGVGGLWRRIGASLAINFYRYIGLLTIASSVMLVVAFAKMRFQSRVVNLVAASSFGVYLFHNHDVVWNWYLATCRSLYLSHSTAEYLLLLIGLFAAIFAFVVMVDQVRIRAFKLLCKFVSRLRSAPPVVD